MACVEVVVVEVEAEGKRKRGRGAWGWVGIAGAVGGAVKAIEGECVGNVGRWVWSGGSGTLLEEGDDDEEGEGEGGDDEAIKIAPCDLIVGRCAPSPASPDSTGSHRRRRFRRLASSSSSSSSRRRAPSSPLPALSRAWLVPSSSSLSSISSPLLSVAPRPSLVRDTSGDAEANGEDDGRMSSSPHFGRVEERENRGVGTNCEEEEVAAGRWALRREGGG